MREICMSGSMSTVCKRGDGLGALAPPDERGRNRHPTTIAAAPTSTLRVCEGRAKVADRPQPDTERRRPGYAEAVIPNRRRRQTLNHAANQVLGTAGPKVVRTYEGKPRMNVGLYWIATSPWLHRGPLP